LLSWGHISGLWGAARLRDEREAANADAFGLDDGDAAFRERVGQRRDVVEQKLCLVLGPALSSGV
jgi:hypothetical protein